MKFVAFDLDSTLNNLHHEIHRLFLNKFAKDIPPTDWKSFSLAATYEMNSDDIHELIYQEGLLQSSTPLPFAKELFAHLQKDNVDIVIITARKCFRGDDLEKITRDWLTQHGLLPSQLHIVLDKKYEVIKAVGGDCLYFLDDNPHLLLETHQAKVAREVIRFDYPWNRHLPEEIRAIKCLSELLPNEPEK